MQALFGRNVCKNKRIGSHWGRGMYMMYNTCMHWISGKQSNSTSITRPIKPINNGFKIFMLLENHLK